MRKKFFKLATSCFFVVSVLMIAAFGPQDISKPSMPFFLQAQINLDQHRQSPVTIRFQEGQGSPVASFFAEYKKAFGLSDENEFKPFNVFTDQLGQTHHRFKQYYKGIELAEVQFILHEKNGMVSYAHGNLIHGLSLDVRPALSETEALQRAKNYIGAESYLWENRKNEAFIKREQNDPHASFYPKGELKISAGRKERRRENFRLVYCFDIYVEKPLGRYEVDVDAKTGEVIDAISRLRQGDVRGQGLSLYNGVVPITVSDVNFPIAPEPPSRWHLNAKNAFGGSGESWWMADPNLGNDGGYDNIWYEVLDTDPITLTGTNPKLTFQHRYAVEAPGEEPAGYNGWDGMNVRISRDDGKTWQVLANPAPAYTNTSLFSFGFIHGEGQGIPGWTNRLNEWTQVMFDLSAFAGQKVQLRFAFASDGGLSTADRAPELFGWQIDDIMVFSSAGPLYSNDGIASGMTASNLVKEATVIAGNYRLRETARGGGLFTYDAQNGSYVNAIDFVDTDSNFTEPNAGAGVSAHWAGEATYDYYLASHGRRSFDDAGGRIVSYVHFGDSFSNAFWDGSRLVFGDGSNNSKPFTALDIVGHEFTHGVTEFSAGLIYANESGALNESFSDIFGEAIESFAKRTDPDWLEGADIGALRSMKDPNFFNDPDTYQGRFWEPSTDTPNPDNDQGGVHHNSGVQNHWFYLLSEGGSGVNDNGQAFNVTGIGLEQAAQIAYRNLTVYLMPNSGFFEARLASIYSARDLFGDNSPQLQSVKDAWFAVGVLRPNPEPTLVVSSDILDFRTEITEEPDTRKLTIVNFGLDTLTINGIQITGASFQIDSSLTFPQRLPYEDEISVAVTFAPNAVGEAHGTLSLLSNDPVNPVKSVQLHGYGFIVNPAKAGILYAVTGQQSNGALLTLNTSTGSGSLISATGYGELTGMTIRPSNGKLLATLAENDSTRLIRIDAESGIAGVLSIIHIGNIRAIAFDSSDALYGISFGIGALYSIDPISGEAALIGFTRLRTIRGLAINPRDGSLWGMTASGAIYKIDKSTATPTLVGSSGFGVNLAMAFAADGLLFGISSSTTTTVNDLMQIDTDTGAGTLIGTTGFKDVFGLAIRGTETTGVYEARSESLPTRYELQQNYPNPFNPSTTIRFSLPRTQTVSLKVYDLFGREIAALFDNERKAAGNHKTIFDASELANGVYLYRLQAGPFTETKKMLLIK